MIAASRSPWNLRLLWFIVPGLGGAVWWWWGISQFVTGQVDLSTNILANISRPAIQALLGLGLWLGSASLSTYLSPWRSIRFTSAVLVALPVLAFFPLTLWTGAAAIVMAVGLAWNYEQMFGDVHNRLLVQPWQTINQNLSVALSAIMIAVAILSYQQVTKNAPNSAASTLKLSGQIVTAAEQFLPSVYKGYTPTMTVDELIGSQLPTADKILADINFDQLTNQAIQQQALDQKLKDIGINPNAVHLDVRQGQAALRDQLTAELNKYRQDSIAEIRQQLADRFGLTLTGREAMHDVLTQYVDHQLTTSLGRFTNFLPLLLAVGVFLLLRLFSFIYTWLIVGWGWAWYAILKAMGVVKVETVTVPGQRTAWGR